MNPKDEPISMYVPARNAEHSLPDCVSAIRGQTRPPDELFIVVDPRSTDRTVEVARQRGVTVIEQTGLTLGAVRNQALMAARHRWVGSCDSDVLLDKHWLASLAARRNQYAVGIGGRTNERVRNPCDAWRALHMPHHWGGYPLRNPFMLVSEVLFDRDALLAVGGYRDDLSYYEDSDLCQRLRDAGYDLLYEPTAVATHQRTDTVVSLLNLRWKYSEHRQRDLLDRFSGLLQKIRVNREYAVSTLSRSLTRGHEELAYISVLLFFHHLLMDLLSLLSRRPLLTPVHRGTFVQELGTAAFDVLERRDPALAAGMRSDLQPISRSIPAGNEPVRAPGWAGHLAATQAAIREFLAELDDVTLSLVGASMRHVHGAPAEIQRLRVPLPQELATILAGQPLTPAVDAAFCAALRRDWPDAVKVKVLGQITEPEVTALQAGFARVPHTGETIALVAHLEAEPDPLQVLKTLDLGVKRMVVCYQMPARYIAGLDVPSASDLASTATAAGWEIARFDTLIGRTRLLLLR